MILITSANGKTGRAVIEALRNRHVPARAMTGSASSAAELETLGVDDVAIGDLRSADDVARACEGASAIYYTSERLN